MLNKCQEIIVVYLGKISKYSKQKMWITQHLYFSTDIYFILYFWNRVNLTNKQTTGFSNSISRILLKKLRNYPLNFNSNIQLIPILSCNNYIHPSIWNRIKKSKFPATIRLSYRNSVFSCTKSRFTAIGSKQPFFGFRIIKAILERFARSRELSAHWISARYLWNTYSNAKKKKKRKFSQRFCIVRIARQVGNYFE